MKTPRRMLEGTARIVDTLDEIADVEVKPIGYTPSGPAPGIRIPRDEPEDVALHHRHRYETKDSGERVEFDSGMRRDTNDGKPRYDLIPLMPLRRLADLYARGAEKYGDSNWELANSQEELDRFKASAFRHFVQWLEGQDDEDHGIAAVWNIFAVLFVQDKIEREVLITDVRRAMSSGRPEVLP